MVHARSLVAEEYEEQHVSGSNSEWLRFHTRGGPIRAVASGPRVVGRCSKRQRRSDREAQKEAQMQL
eukprot:5651855-Prymnesium_polylepis.1